MNRRNFLMNSTLVGGYAFLKGDISGGAAPRYDLVVKGGLVIDPSLGIHDVSDVGICAGRITAVEKDIPLSLAKEYINASGRIVAPGLIDLHVHSYWGVTVWGIEADPTMLAKGSTTVVDAGSAGYYTFPGFKRYVIDKTAARMLAFLNIASIGLVSGEVQELEDLRHANVKLAVKMANQNRDVVVGIKVRLGITIVHENDLTALKIAREAADELNLPVMVHIGNDFHSMNETFPLLRKGDIVTHCFNGHPNGITDERDRILPVTWDAADRGVYFDVGHGGGSFHWKTAEAALQQGLLPTTISTDLHTASVNGPAYDLPAVMTKFLFLGMALDKVIELVTIAPARVLKREDCIGSMRIGFPADIALLTLEEGDFTLLDCKNEPRKTDKKLTPWKTIRNGVIYS